MNTTACVVGKNMPLLKNITLSAISHYKFKSSSIISSGCFYLSKLKLLKYYILKFSKIGDEGINKLLRNTFLANSDFSI